MKYINAEVVLPKELLEQVQKYIQGKIIYIPKDNDRVPWGTESGARENIISRNKEITILFENGDNIEYLSKKFYLSEHTIRKIVSRNKGE